MSTLRISPGPRAQHGSALFFALIALVSLALASVALVRSVDTGTLVMGNLGLKQDATSASDQAAEAAITWITNNLAGSTLNNDNAAAGYYASSIEALDVTGGSNDPNRALVDWNGDDCAYGSFTLCIKPSAFVTYKGSTESDPVKAKYEIKASYVITRLCTVAGPVAAGGCVTPITKVGGKAPSRGSVSYVTERLSEAGGGPYYRIVVRAVGARGTASYTETVLHF